MSSLIVALFLQSAQLIHYDIYDCTKPNVYQTHTHITYANDVVTIREDYFPEKNPLANIFFKDGNFDTPYALAVVGNLLVSTTLNNIDPQWSKLYMAAINFGEVLAIASWNKAKDDIKVSALVYAQEF